MADGGGYRVQRRLQRRRMSGAAQRAVSVRHREKRVFDSEMLGAMLLHGVVPDRTAEWGIALSRIVHPREERSAREGGQR